MTISADFASTDSPKPASMARCRATASNISHRGLYIVDHEGDRVWKLAAGSSTPTVVPITGDGSPYAVAVDNVGNLYVAWWGSGNHRRVLKLTAG